MLEYEEIRIISQPCATLVWIFLVKSCQIILCEHRNAVIKSIQVHILNPTLYYYPMGIHGRFGQWASHFDRWSTQPQQHLFALSQHSQEFCGRPMGPVTTMKKTPYSNWKMKDFSSKIDMFFISKPFIYPSFPTNFSIYDQETCCVPHASSNSLNIFFAFHSIHPMSIFFLPFTAFIQSLHTSTFG